MITADQALPTATALAEAALGHAPGTLEPIESRSHRVFVGAEVVVKIIDADDHARLDREIALAVDLPDGLSAPVLSSGSTATPFGEVRYACIGRLPGASPGMGLPGVDRETALRWARQAIVRLQALHAWTPAAPAAEVLRERLDHGGFVGRRQLLERIERVRELDTTSLVPRAVLDGLVDIASRAPEHARIEVPVHADCHWGNWLVDGPDVIALLDFEWARFGEPDDDWMFLARFSGQHLHDVLELIAETTGRPVPALRAACELREAAHVSADLELVLADADRFGGETADELRLLHDIVVDRLWWLNG